MPSPAVGQLPQQHQMFLDHVGWMVPDMAAAADAFLRLGFTLTPLSVHGNRDPATGALLPSGTANRLVMLQHGYLEILTAEPGAATPLAQHLQAAVRRRVGVHLLAFAVADAEDEGRLLRARGVSLQPTVHLRRTVEAEDGTTAEVAFTVVRADFAAFPEARVQILTHHTPQHMWQRRYAGHDNAIVGLAEAVLAVDDPAAVAARFARFAGRPAAGGENPVIAFDRGRLRFMTRAAAEITFGGVRLPPNPSVAALVLVSSDLERTGYVCRAHGLVPRRLGGEQILIDAADAMGVYLVIGPA